MGPPIVKPIVVEGLRRAVVHDAAFLSGSEWTDRVPEDGVENAPAGYRHA